MCGFISIIGPEGTDVIADILSGLLAIQHRGQDAAGAVTFGDKFQAKKGLGLVRDVFQEKHLKRLSGHLAVGHVRYPTVGVGEDTDVQPFWLDFPVGIAMAHNGNVTNIHELCREYFPKTQPLSRMSSTCDLEAVLQVFAMELIKKNPTSVSIDDVKAAVESVFREVKGAYSVVGTIAGAGMFAFRDPHGIKPIIVGEKTVSTGKIVAAASESVVLDVAGYEVIGDLKAGELMWVDSDRNIHRVQVGDKPHRPCVFEYIYFARPDSRLDGISVYEARLELGERLADRWKTTGIEIDAVIPVPESARTAAQAMAERLQVPYREGFVKNRYVGRTFIMPSDEERRATLRHKLNPLRMEFEGKNVLIVDDSIVRGNTCKQIVKIARQMGAKNVYLASYSAPLIHPCPYGIDMATKRDFIALGKTEAEVAAELGADFLIYQTVDDMVGAVERIDCGNHDFCRACFTGDYPTGDITPEMLADIANDRILAGSTGDN